MMSAISATKSMLLAIHRLGDDEQAGLLPGSREQLEPGASQPLERIGRAARLEGAGPKHRGAGLADGASRLEDLPLALDRAGTRHDHDLVAANGEPAGRRIDGRVRLPLARHLLVRLGDVDDLLDAGQRGEPGPVHPAVVAHEPDGRALLARHRARLIAHLLDGGDHASDVLFGCAVAHDDQH